jgi:hypothetical protein
MSSQAQPEETKTLNVKQIRGNDFSKSLIIEVDRLIGIHNIRVSVSFDLDHRQILHPVSSVNQSNGFTSP